MNDTIMGKRKNISLETKVQILDNLASGSSCSFVGKIFNLNEATIRTIKKNEVAIRKSFKFPSYQNETTQRKRKSISLETKVKILDHLAFGDGSSYVGRVFNLSEATIRSIKKNEGAIRKSLMFGTQPSAKFSSYTRATDLERMEKKLVCWIDDNAGKGILLNGNRIRQDALRIYNEDKALQQPSTLSVGKGPTFTASKGWLAKFLKRHALINGKDIEINNFKSKTTID